MPALTKLNAQYFSAICKEVSKLLPEVKLCNTGEELNILFFYRTRIRDVSVFHDTFG